MAEMIEYSHAKTLYFTSTRHYILDNINSSNLVSNYQLEARILTTVFEQFPEREHLVYLLENFHSISQELSFSGIQFLAYLNCKTILRGASECNLRQLQESILRVTLTQEDGAIWYVDIPYSQDVENIISEMKKWISIQMQQAKLEYDSEFSWEKIDSVILAPRAAAYLVHEIFGHTLEYDYVKSGRSVVRAGDKGSRIFPPGITIKDAPLSATNLGLKFSTSDDVGRPLQDITIVRDGIIENFIMNQRASSYNNEPLFRMYNLFADANSNGENLETIIKNTESGVVINQIPNGFINPEIGTFSLQCSDCMSVCSGKINKRVPSITLKSTLHSVADSLIHIGSDLENSVSYCSKNGQVVPVGVGSPSFVFNIDIIGSRD